MIKVCKMCGKEFEAKTDQQLYCDLECRAAFNRQRQVKWYQLHKAEAHEYYLHCAEKKRAKKEAAKVIKECRGSRLNSG